MADLKSEVLDALRTAGSPAGAAPLWEEIYGAFRAGRPDGVWNLLDKKVKAIRSAAKAQEKEIKEATGGVARRARAKKRR